MMFDLMWLAQRVDNVNPGDGGAGLQVCALQLVGIGAFRRRHDQGSLKT